MSTTVGSSASRPASRCRSSDMFAKAIQGLKPEDVAWAADELKKVYDA